MAKYAGQLLSAYRLYATAGLIILRPCQALRHMSHMTFTSQGCTYVACCHALHALALCLTTIARTASGKTSLMSALAGKASYGTVTGSVTINGKPDKLLRYKRVMGFVPQVGQILLLIPNFLKLKLRERRKLLQAKFIYCKFVVIVTNPDNLAEWSKALDLGSSPKGREFKSHSCHYAFVFSCCAWFALAVCTMLFSSLLLCFNAISHRFPTFLMSNTVVCCIVVNTLCACQLLTHQTSPCWHQDNSNGQNKGC